MNRAMRILLVEDDAEVARFVLKGLKEAGHSAEHATNGRDGLFLAEGAEWRRQRRLVAPAFAPRALVDAAPDKLFLPLGEQAVAAANTAIAMRHGRSRLARPAPAADPQRCPAPGRRAAREPPTRFLAHPGPQDTHWRDLDI